MDQPSSPLSPSPIDKNLIKLAETVESIYGNPWGIIWRNFLAGFMRVFGMAFAYVLLLVIIFTIVVKSGILAQAQGLWKNIIQGLITDVQKNMEKSLLQQNNSHQPLTIDPELLKNIVPQPNQTP